MGHYLQFAWAHELVCVYLGMRVVCDAFHFTEEQNPSPTNQDPET